MTVSRWEVERIHAADIRGLPAPGTSPRDRDEEFALKRWLLVRTIVESIAGMTDTYAKARNRELCV